MLISRGAERVQGQCHATRTRGERSSRTATVRVRDAERSGLGLTGVPRRSWNRGTAVTVQQIPQRQVDTGYTQPLRREKNGRKRTSERRGMLSHFYSGHNWLTLYLNGPYTHQDAPLTLFTKDRPSFHERVLCWLSLVISTELDVGIQSVASRWATDPPPWTMCAMQFWYENAIKKFQLPLFNCDDWTLVRGLG